MIEYTNKGVTVERPKGAKDKYFGRRSKSNAVYVPHNAAQTLDDELANAPAFMKEQPKMRLKHTKSVKEYAHTRNRGID